MWRNALSFGSHKPCVLSTAGKPAQTSWRRFLHRVVHKRELPSADILLASRAVRVGTPIIAIVALSVLLCVPGGAEPAEVGRAARPTAEGPRDALDTYLILTRR